MSVQIEKTSDIESKFTIPGKEYSLAGVIGSKLNETPKVVMAGSRVIDNLEVIVIVKQGEDPKECFKSAVTSLESDIDGILNLLQPK